MKPQLVISLLAVFSIALSGCETILKLDSNSVKHMLALKGNGGIYDIEVEDDKNGKTLSSQEGLREQVKGIIDNIKRENRKRILIYIPGGLNGIKGAIKDGKKLISPMKQPNVRNDNDTYYPIIVNWESGMDHAYTDHLFRIRQGRRDLFYGIPTFPFYLLADVGRALTRYPVTMATQFYRDLFPIPVSQRKDIEGFNGKFSQRNPSPDQIILGENKIERFDGTWWKDRATVIFPGVTRLLTTPLLDAFGKSGWDNMLRRTQTVFRRPREFDRKLIEAGLGSRDSERKGKVGASERISSRMKQLSDNLAGKPPPSLNPFLSPDKSRPTGGLSHLMEALRILKKEEPGRDIKVTLIGHSMGTIILSELIRIYGDKDKDYPYDEIVYLAAACTIRDFEQSVIPYLKANEQSRFYNVTLHPFAERQEKNFSDVFPRGSLLNWIDDYTSKPASFMELTLGKWNNAIMAWHIIPDIVRRRHQVTLKGFGMEDPQMNNRRSLEDPEKILMSKPQEHGDFNDPDQLFWQPDYWKNPNL